MRLKIIFQIVVIGFFVLVALGYFFIMTPKYLVALYASAQNLIQSPRVVKLVQNAIRPYLPVTTPEEMFSKVNQYRQSLKLPALSREATVCDPTGKYDPSSENVFSVCPTCTHVTLLSISQYADSNTLMEQLIADASAKDTLTATNLTHLCVGVNNEMLTLFFAQKSANQPKPQGSVPLKPSATSPTRFSEDELWKALMEYRKAQNRTELSRDENICIYARKRVADHLTLQKEKKPEDYPVPDKYPLDGHSGFSADAASGYAFEVTKKNQLAENLAYWPSAKSPVHIIEWGWDSSTEGHREAQLSNDWTSACITGDQGFYVAIFGK